MNEHFVMPARQKTVSLVLLVLGLIAIIAGAAAYGLHNPRFWASILHNSIFALLICVASIFILTATTLAQAGWTVAFRRVPESIASVVWVLGIITGVVILILVWGGHTEIYPWLTTDPNDPFYLKDKIITSGANLNGTKQFFLSKGFFSAWTVLTIVAWGFFGYKFRALSVEEDGMPAGVARQHWRTNKWAAGFAFVFALTLASTIPWLWIMSIDSHWFSTMFSWYTFASSFVSGMSMILLWVLYLKSKGYYEVVSHEHIHDLGKFMFAFSVFWTYLWFSQFMLIWYANIPEETVYFQPRFHGPYRVFFWLNLILNFVSPILILMSRPAKRNYFIVSLVAVIIIFGHWIDFYQMIHPGTEGRLEVAEKTGKFFSLGLFELGVPLFFIGLIIQLVGRKLGQAALTPKNHPFLKETIIHVV
jgi:hypothetical protein